MCMIDRVKGCLLSGAVGDAMGGAVEFDSWDTIRSRYGEGGIDTVVPPGRFTDDTQMALFTADGVIRALIGDGDAVDEVYRAYRRWLHTQGRAVEHDLLDGWLVADRRLRRRQAPGATCLSALESGLAGTADKPINDSKGCGAVMRAAPIGLAYPPDQAWELGCATGAITHGHRDGWQPAGALAAVISSVCAGSSLLESVRAAAARTDGGTRRLLGEAIRVAAVGLPGPLEIKVRLGEGWVGDEALAISVACALAAPDLRSAITAAVNHSGDSDSTGAICGNILGAVVGPGAVPAAWIEALDAADLVETVANDLAAATLDGPRQLGPLSERYPAARLPGPGPLSERYPAARPPGPGPLSRSYWVGPQLLAGVYPGSANQAAADEKLAAILDSGVTLFLDLTTPADGLHPYEEDLKRLSGGGARRVAVPIADLTAATPAVVRQALDVIDAETDAGGTTYVHCWGGIGRTGTIVGCWLARRLGGAAALVELASLRSRYEDNGRRSPETPDQVAVVRNWPRDGRRGSGPGWSATSSGHPYP
jgi:ADP-ribosyl-[dinitrogen reductase] hydrolase